MTALSRPKWERFAQLIASGLSNGAAYEQAGYATEGHVSESAGERLLSNVEVRARVDELLAAEAERLSITADDIAREAWKIATTGRIEVARVSALTLLAKRHKEFSEKHILSGDPEQPVIVERRTRSTR